MVKFIYKEQYVIIEIIFIYIVYLVMLILGTYYVNLYLSKDNFTKDELKDVLPYLTKLWATVTTKYSMSIMLICLGVASLVGALLPLLSQNWFLNSGIIFIVMFLSFPFAIKNFNMSRITTGGTFYDTAMNIFVNNSSFIFDWFLEPALQPVSCTIGEFIKKLIFCGSC